MPGGHELRARDGEGPSCLPPLATLCNSWTTSQDRSHAPGAAGQELPLVRWFVLSTTDLCQEDQGPNRSPWPALSGTHREVWLSPAPPLPQKPPSRPPPWLLRVLHLPVDLRPASRGRLACALPPPGRGQLCPPPLTPLGFAGGLQLEKHQEALHSPLGLLYIFSFYSRAVNIFNPVHTASSSDTETILSAIPAP